MCILLQFPALQAIAEWSREQILSGQWWRIVTGNFTHTNVTHLCLNLASVWVICFLFRPSSAMFAGVTSFSAVTIGLGIFVSEIQIYLGLSGILHALFAFLALREALQGRQSSWLLVIGVIGKVALEQIQGAPESTAKLIQANVAIEAHLIGAITGLTLAILLQGYQYYQQRQYKPYN
nr:rhombosortase [Vibrio hippocampi]